MLSAYHLVVIVFTFDMRLNILGFALAIDTALHPVQGHPSSGTTKKATEGKPNAVTNATAFAITVSYQRGRIVNSCLLISA
jgi:hypothetical protein